MLETEVPLNTLDAFGAESSQISMAVSIFTPKTGILKQNEIEDEYQLKQALDSGNLVIRNTVSRGFRHATLIFDYYSYGDTTIFRVYDPKDTSPTVYLWEYDSLVHLEDNHGDYTNWSSSVFFDIGDIRNY